MNQSYHDFAVELKHVSKLYGRVCAIDNVSLEIKQGEYFCLLGPSGCGKSTTLNIIGGFIPLSKGEVLIAGKIVTNDLPYRRDVNTVFQNYALFPHMTVAENISFGLRMKQTQPEEIKHRLEEMLSQVSMEWAGDRRAKQLSGGQQQRVALARALINRPAVLLLDEPLGALDLKLRKQLQMELLNIQRNVGITFVHVTHDQEEAMFMSDRIAVISEGKVAQIGTPSDLYYSPKNRFVADFIGESNFFTGQVIEINEENIGIKIEGFKNPVWVPSDENVSNGKEVTVMIRPERINLSSSQPPNAENVTNGILTKIIFLGMYTQFDVKLGSTLTKIFSPNSSDSAENWTDKIGNIIYLSWKPQDGKLLLE